MTAPLPQMHQQLFGHVQTVQQLKKSFDAGKLHHTLIFSGPEGVGKETLAYQLMRYILVNPQGNPKQDDLKIPETHRVFSQVVSGNHPNIRVITPVFDEKKQRYARDINLDALDSLTNFLRLAPTDDSYRFVLIHPADSLSRITQNALLKVLEEPPEKTFFILISGQTGSLLPTIKSRCLTIHVGPLTEKDFSKGMDYFASDTSHNAIHGLYVLTKGSLGQALSYQDKEILSLYGDVCRSILSWQEGDSQPAMHFAEAWAGEGEQAEALQNLWLNRLADVMKAQLRQQPLEAIIPEEERLLAVWRTVNPQILLASYDRLQNLWNEGEAGYLDKKLLILKALGFLSTMDNTKNAVLA